MWSSSGVLAAVDVKDFTGNKLGFFKEDDGMDNLVYVPQAAHRMQSRSGRSCGQLAWKAQQDIPNPPTHYIQKHQR